MKKILAICILLAALSINANAQQTTEKPQMSKEEKVKMREKQEQDLQAAFKEIGLTDEQIKQCKEIIVDANKKTSEVRKDATLTDEQKETKRKEINTEKNNKLKEVMGEEKFKQFNSIRKKQKDANTASPNKE